MGRTDAQGGYRHSARVCPLSADTIIANCSGFAYKYINTSITGRITVSGGGGQAGVTVTLTRCRTPQSLGSTSCAQSDGFSVQDTTNGNGDFSFGGLLEGIYEVRPAGASGATPGSRLVQTAGSGASELANFTIF